MVLADNFKDYSSYYDPERDFDRFYTLAALKRILPFVKKNDNVLELGSATGMMTEVLAGKASEIVCVEKSAAYIFSAKKKRMRNVKFVNCEIEDFSTREKFDHIVMTNVMHELPDPIPVLNKISLWIKKNGKLHITVPNPNSLHRQVAAKAGILKNIKSIGERARQHFTLHLYTNDEVKELIKKHSGLSCIHHDGILLKPLPNDMLEKLDPKILQALDSMGSEYKEMSAMSYLVFSHKKEKKK